MNTCPHCGADLKPKAATCDGCGRTFVSGKKSSAHKKAKKVCTTRKKRKKTKPKYLKEKTKKASIPEIVGEPVDVGYDGYYNDVLPPDLDRTKEGMDKELLKKISILMITAILAIGICVVMLYLL